MVSREQKIKEIREIVKNNPTLSSKEHLDIAQKKGVSIRKTDFLKERRDVLNLPEPTIEKKEKSIPIKHRTPSQKIKVIKRAKLKIKKPRIPFDQTKFGMITRDLQKVHGISERQAIIIARRILKIPRIDYDQLDQMDFDILIQYGY